MCLEISSLHFCSVTEEKIFRCLLCSSVDGPHYVYISGTGPTCFSFYLYSASDKSRIFVLGRIVEMTDRCSSGDSIPGT